jgi:hypothetical protein
MKETIILILTICSFTTANCQVVETINGFTIVKSEHQTFANTSNIYTVSELQGFLKNKIIFVRHSDERIADENIESVENRFVFEKTFECEDLFINENLSNQDYFIVIKSNDCIIRFKRLKNGTFNVESNCLIF